MKYEKIDDKILLINGDCFNVMDRMIKQNKKINVVLTSPPYNTGRPNFSQKALDNHEGRYDIYLDTKTNEEYIDWTIKLFNKYNKILEKDGVILYNLSYSSENTQALWLTISDIIRKTNFTIADDIIWKKKSALPNNVSSNKLTRIVEHVFVFCRKEEFKTFQCNKKVKSRSKTGQKYYENIFNFIEAKNNDGSCKLNKATFSSDLVEQLLNIYANDSNIVYDSFMGTGTTAVACDNLNLECIGSELSEEQWKYSIDRVNENK
jgi:DNA modification methylase